MSLVDDCYRRALRTLESSAGVAGFAAAAIDDHYAAVWSRDAALTILGALVAGRADDRAVAYRTLDTLVACASPLGQIPVAVWPARRYWDWGEAGCTDSTALFIVAAAHVCRASADPARAAALLPAVRRAFTWLRYQDANNMGLIHSPEAADWMDSTLNRSGKVLYVNVLYRWAAAGLNALCAQCGLPPEADPEDLRERLNLLFWPALEADYGRLLAHTPFPPGAVTQFPHPASVTAFRAAARSDRSYYVASVRYGTFVDECDVLANALAILTDAPSSEQAARIADHLIACALDPYPARSWTTTFDAQSDRFQLLNPEAERHQAPRWRNPPGQYHNGAVWPFIGGWVVCALVRVGRVAAARAALEALAAANALNDWAFPEWIDATTGAPGGATGQTWNAGSYIAAFHAVHGQPFRW